VKSGATRFFAVTLHNNNDYSGEKTEYENNLKIYTHVIGLG
jgi:hypothetical protein